MQEPYFMNNQKISARQVKRTLTLELLGISTLLLPSLVATDSGVDGFFALTAGGGGAWLLLKFWQKHFRQTGITACGNGGRSLFSSPSELYGKFKHA